MPTKHKASGRRSKGKDDDDAYDIINIGSLRSNYVVKKMMPALSSSAPINIGTYMEFPRTKSVSMGPPKYTSYSINLGPAKQSGGPAKQSGGPAKQSGGPSKLTEGPSTNTATLELHVDDNDGSSCDSDDSGYDHHDSDDPDDPDNSCDSYDDTDTSDYSDESKISTESDSDDEETTDSDHNDIIFNIELDGKPVSQKGLT